MAGMGLLNDCLVAASKRPANICNTSQTTTYPVLYPNPTNTTTPSALPGLINIITSGVLAIFSLAVGGSYANTNLCASFWSSTWFGYYYSSVAPSGECDDDDGGAVRVGGVLRARSIYPA